MGLILNNDVLTALKQVSEVAKYLWDRGWAERNGGNLSLNLTEKIGNLQNELMNCRYLADSRIPKQLAHHTFFVTGAGVRKRDLTSGLEAMAKNGCIIFIDQNAEGYHIVWGAKDEHNFQPTSELSSHLGIHLDLIKRRSPNRAVLHAHPAELIALSHSKKYCRNSKELSKYLWSMMPEVKIFVPRGIGLVPYFLPGTEKLAALTIKTLQKFDVALWAKHGAITTGKDIIDAFDYLDVANKGAKIFLQSLAAGFMPSGLSGKQLKELEQECLLAGSNVVGQ